MREILFRHFDDEPTYIDFIPRGLWVKLMRSSPPGTSINFEQDSPSDGLMRWKLEFNGRGDVIWYEIFESIEDFDRSAADRVAVEDPIFYLFDFVLGDDRTAGETLYNRLVRDRVNGAEVGEVDWIFVTAFPAKLRPLGIPDERAFPKPLDAIVLTNRLYGFVDRYLNLSAMD